MTKEGGLTKKRLVRIFYCTVGAGSAAAVDHWPQHAATTQMVFYTVIIFGPVFLGLWADIHRRVFWIGIALALALHSVLLYSIRSMFPFRSILIVIPIALIEGTAVLALMLKILGDRNAERAK